MILMKLWKTSKYEGGSACEERERERERESSKNNVMEF
jgi:hypothetical protein